MSEDVVHEAEPLLSETLPQPLIVLPPALKFIVPVGVPVTGGTADTVTVKLTDWPWTFGSMFDVRTIEVLGPTVWVSGDGVEVAQVPLAA